MDFWFLLIFILAVLLASSRTEAQTPTTHMTSGTTDLPNPTTTIAIPVTNPLSTTTTAPTTTTFPPPPATATPTTITTSLPESTSLPEATTITTSLPEATTITTSLPEATTITTSLPEATTITTSLPEATTITTSLPESTSLPEATTITTSLPEATTITTSLPESTSLPEATTITTSLPEATSSPEASTITASLPGATSPPEATTITTSLSGSTSPPEATTITTSLPEATSSPEASTITTSLSGSTSPPVATTITTSLPEATYSPEATITTSSPEASTITTSPPEVTYSPEATTITTSLSGATSPPVATTITTSLPEDTYSTEATITTSSPEASTITTSLPEATYSPESTTITTSLSEATSPPEATTITTSSPEASTITTYSPEATTITTSLSGSTSPPVATTITTSLPEDTYSTEATITTSSPEASTITTSLSGSTSPPVATTNTTSLPEATYSTEATIMTSSSEASTITTSPPEATYSPESTTITTSLSEATSPPEATTITTSSPEASTITTYSPEATTITTYSPEATTITTSLSEATSLPEATTITTSLPEASTITTSLSEATSPPEATTITTSLPESTTITTLIPSPTTASPAATTTPPPPPPTTTTTTAAAPTTTTPPTTTPLVCNNGGVSQNGLICICPDEWAGETCSEPNFCEGQRVGGFNFPQTPIGWFAYSEETCNKDTSNADKPRASARCSSFPNGSISFNSLQEFQCDVTLSDVQQNLTSPAQLETLAASTQILTSKPEQLTAENVTAAADIANTLLLSPNATESVRVAAVATVSQLLNASVPDDTKENNTTLRLTQTLDQLSLNLSASLNSNQSNVVQPNLVVQSAQIPAANTQGVQFTSLKGESGSFVANRIKLNTNTSTVEVGDKFAADALILIRFPPEAANSRQRPTNVSLGFVLYQNGNFFRSRLYRGPRASIRVLSASVTGQERSVVPQHVEMHFRPTLKNGTSLYNFACVFWNYSLGDWSTAGCSKGNASDGVLRCFCNHTTNFAALWSFKEQYEYAKPLQVISIVGLSFSIFGLVVTIIHHIKENFYRSAQKNKNSKIALLCICISLLAFIITFLSGVQNSNKQNDTKQEISNETNQVLTSDEHVEPDHGSCTAVAALLQFFLVATFMWNTVYGTQLVLLIRTMRPTLPPHWTSVSVAAGWGVPAVIMAITLGATYSVRNPLGYRREEFCWLAALNKDNQFDFGKPMFWGFLLPVGLMLIYNIVLLVLFSLTICKTDPMLTSTNPSSLRKKFLSSISLAVLLGLSWSLGYLVLVTTGEANTVLSILFCICTSTQGLLIFILFTARTPTFRATVSRSLRYVSSVNIPLNYTTYSLWKNSGKSTSSESYRDIKDETKTL
ncbi:adhesion G-protein coupled receptor G7-like [Thunnus maccoyii]|uniref:adhesion G-protein coupled receptor G7-like n=1 Tax=Thunnus maccoyii TaxID=8240 RepID=UPI001C4B3181|nr:adhesion G-protein coupled receptor G7-like [Thunnus maccoyii]